MESRDNIFKKFDWLMFIPVFLLSIIGMSAIYSTDLSGVSLGFANFKKQLIAFLISLVVLFLLAATNYRQIKNAKNILYFLLVGILLAVLFFGSKVRGTTGWFLLGPVGFQPVELAKIGLVIFLADYFSREGRRMFGFFDLVKSFIPLGIFLVLVFLQPDLGSAIILFLIWAGMLFVSSARKKHLIFLIAMFIALTVLAWFFLLADYQKNRIAVFINPNLDPLGVGYNIKQSIIAIGSGGFFGKGLGFGSQSQLRFLPEAHTDFIFALIAEELGFFMVLIILFLYALYFFRVLRLAEEGGGDFVVFMAVGFFVMVLSQAIINMGMNLGLMPVTGLPLPFVSLGGSSMLANFIAVGILQSARMRV